MIDASKWSAYSGTWWGWVLRMQEERGWDAEAYRNKHPEQDLNEHVDYVWCTHVIE